MLEAELAAPRRGERTRIEVCRDRLHVPRSCGCRSIRPRRCEPAGRCCTTSNCCSSIAAGVPFTLSSTSAMRSGGPSESGPRAAVLLARCPRDWIAARVQLLAGPRGRHDDVMPLRVGLGSDRLAPRYEVAADAGSRRPVSRRAKDAIDRDLSLCARSAADRSAEALRSRRCRRRRCPLQRALAAQRGGEALRVEPGITSSRGSKRGASSVKRQGNCELCVSSSRRSQIERRGAAVESAMASLTCVRAVEHAGVRTLAERPAKTSRAVAA